MNQSLDELNHDDFVDGKGVKIKSNVSVKLDSLSRYEIFGYGVGHFQNDLCAACWFNYMLYFMKNVVFLKYEDSGFYAGLVLLSGQIADGIATPIVGYFSDRTHTRIGKRTPWYVFGTILVTICFVFLFQECLFCEWFGNDSAWLMMFYYIFFPSLFNVGWASVQVAHMSLVPSLTLSRKQRDSLNALRNTFTYLANLYVLTAAFIIFLSIDHGFTQFRILSFASIGLGFFTSIIFLVSVNEKRLTNDCLKVKKMMKDLAKEENRKDHPETYTLTRDTLEKNHYDKSGINEIGPLPPQSSLSVDNKDNQRSFSATDNFTWTQWFKLSSFYIYGFVYMGSRVLVNVQSSLIIFYLQNVLGIAKKVNTYDHGLPVEFAIIPIIIYLSSAITSGILKRFYEKFGRKRMYVVGTSISIGTTTVMMILSEESRNYMFGVSVLIGMSQSICLNTGIGLISEVVGVRGPNGAFVFGCYSLLEKFANGILLYGIMNIRDVSSDSNVLYIRVCAALIPCCGAILACILVLIGKAKDYDCGDLITEGSIVDEYKIKNQLKTHLLKNSKIEIRRDV